MGSLRKLSPNNWIFSQTMFTVELVCVKGDRDAFTPTNACDLLGNKFDFHFLAANLD